MKIGIYGGTFDPPHIGHVNAAKEAVRFLKLDKLLVIPANTPPHKDLPDNAPSAEARLDMTRLAMSGVENTSVSDMELRRGGKSYTSDTLRILREEYPQDELFLIMGTDMLLSFETWHDFEAVLNMCVLAVFTRRSGEEETVKRAVSELAEKYGARAVYVPHEVFEASSSDIRRLLPLRAGKEYLPESVYEYIIKNRIYGAKAEFSWLRERAYSMLKPKRIPHVAGCEQEAVRLAERWGADAEKAREAAILHDITKKEPLSEQLLLCDKYGIITDSDERSDSKLLHAKTAAAIAQYEFGTSSETANAILWHTTGRENMTLLEKIIYMADYIEPTRAFEGLEELRALAYEDLDRALLMGLMMSYEDMKERGIVPHGRTMSAANYQRELLKDRDI